MAYVDPKKSKGLELCISLLAFHCVKGSHSGENLAAIVFRLLKRAGITNLDAEAQISCFPYVINICCQHTLVAFANHSLDDDDEDDEDDDNNNDNNGNNNGDVDDNNNNNNNNNDGDDGNILTKIHKFVKAMQASGQQQEAFESLIEVGNTLKYWHDNLNKPIHLKAKKSILDSKTQWGSTLLMLIWLLECRRFLLMDKEWSHIADMVGILLHVMVKEKTPVLAGAIPSLKRFMSRWERHAEMVPRLRAPIKLGLKFAYKYYQRMDNTTAYVIAMCE
ncbi:hypothetical protein Hypma_014780 [Hypsizygus marmoreus]|uniref:Uncharacterized protein n=1 Tax=Hypsizygus marmoreus TaxID=39966 RepID=A0A369J8Z3_HYPMA|nr:hypothetical protein Hypma_014780 [Hypsizygus marmoreus]